MKNDFSQIKEQINSSITDVVVHYITDLKQHGTTLKACCPFHNEKTPSFTVTPSKNMFKCFGCGKGGDAISFIMEHEKVEFIEALQLGAKILSITFEPKELTDKERAQIQHRESLLIVLKKAALFFVEKIFSHKEAIEYLEERGYKIDEENNPLAIGFAPNGNELIKWANKEAINIELIKEVGLVAEKDGKHYDFFRERIMFPIYGNTNNIVGFTGRYIGQNSKAAKYLNSKESKLFNKSELLFGLNLAKTSITDNKCVYLVEGNFDVARLHQIGIYNTISPCGTAFTEQQAQLLKKHTNTVVLIFDGDTAGQKATERTAEILIENKLFVNVLHLPEGKDPDDFFTSEEQFHDFLATNKKDFIISMAASAEKIKDVSTRVNLNERVSRFIALYDESARNVFLDGLAEAKINTKKYWEKAIKEHSTTEVATKESSSIPEEIELADFQNKGFYEYSNCYYFSNAKGAPKRQSNFIIEPLFHIESTIEAKRIFRVTNRKGVMKVIEITQKELVALNSFKVKIESLGNFIWKGTEANLADLREHLYTEMKTCKEVIQLGWQKEGFFAWSNGIFSNEFKPVDDFGIIKYKNHNYYIPAHSHIYKNDEQLFAFERNFTFSEGEINLKDYTKKYVDVFSDNGKIALCFYFASLFRDIVIQRFSKYPMLNLFGPKGAGKNGCAEMLLYFFGLNTKMPNLHNTSKPALADHVGTSVNAICGFDEYRDDLDMEKREFLKGLWDGTGRTRMNMDRDKKRETSKVDQAIIVCGQQMATADIALYSRFMVLNFIQTEFCNEEKQRFAELEKIAKNGITHLTNYILMFRSIVDENYTNAVKQTEKDLSEHIKIDEIETRILNNWLSVISVYSTLKNVLELPFTYNEIIKLTALLIEKQNSQIKKNSDIAKFWKKIEMMVHSGELIYGGDLRIDIVKEFNRKYFSEGREKIDKIEFNETKKVLIFQQSTAISKYQKIMRQEGNHPLPESTITNYLENDKAFICTSRKQNFKKFDPKTNSVVRGEDGRAKYNSTTAFVFEYEKLNVDLEIINESEVEEQQENEKTNSPEQGDLPF
jgi:DNA primase